MPGPTGPAGPAGTAGPAGPAGPAGRDGVEGYELRTSQEIPVEPDQPLAHWEHCSDGKVALGGGYYVSRGEGIVPASMPLLDEAGTPVGWSVGVINTSPDVSVYLRVYALCGLAR